MTLRHDRVGVRPLRLRDRTDWRTLRGRNIEWLRRWEATIPPGAFPATVSFSAMVREGRRSARAGSALPLVITYEDQLVGQVTVTGITWGSARWGQVGYWIDQRLAGRGVTPVAVALVIDHCFDVVGLHRIEIAVRPENTASLRVAEKLGFRHEGLALRYLHIDGDWRDHVLFALTAEEARRGVLEGYLLRRS